MKKRVLVLTTILLLSLLATSTVSAGKGPRLPTWEQVFNPVPIYGDGDFWPYLATFNNQLIVGPFYSEAAKADQLWASKDGKNWRLAWSASDIQEGGEGIWAPPYVFKNRLYVQVIVCIDEENCEARIVRTRNGRSWEKVYWSTPETDIPYGFASFKGSLYIWYSIESDSGGVTHLLRSRSGDPGTWQEVAEFPPGFGVGSFESFKGRLYLSSDFVYDADGNNLPAQVWASDDGVRWVPVTLDAFGDPTNLRGGAFGQKDGYLYASVGVFSPTAGDIYRTMNGVDWEPVNLDGFGDPENILVSSFVTYRGVLYAYYASGKGCQVYASHDSLSWTPVNEPGWGEPRNIGPFREYGRTIFKGDLYTATIGPGGVMKLATPAKLAK